MIEMVINENLQLFDMRDTAEYISQTYRWLQRNYLRLMEQGVEVFRLPKDSTKGHLWFSRDSLDKYLKNCRIKLDKTVINDL
jgi:hypothetical protein